MQIKTSKLYRIASSIGSFLVGVGALFIIKLALMLPLNLSANERNFTLIQSIGGLLFILSIYLAFKWTKRINAVTEVKRRRIYKMTVLFFGFLCMVISNVILIAAK